MSNFISLEDLEPKKKVPKKKTDTMRVDFPHWKGGTLRDWQIIIEGVLQEKGAQILMKSTQLNPIVSTDLVFKESFSDLALNALYTSTINSSVT